MAVENPKLRKLLEKLDWSKEYGLFGNQKKNDGKLTTAYIPTTYKKSELFLNAINGMKKAFEDDKTCEWDEKLIENYIGEFEFKKSSPGFFILFDNENLVGYFLIAPKVDE